MQIDPDNHLTAMIHLFPVAPSHQDALVDILIKDVARRWSSLPQFEAAAVHRSRDGTRVFAYSQWHPRLDVRDLSAFEALGEFYSPDAHEMEVFAAKTRSGSSATITVGGPVTHLAEFRMRPENQPGFTAMASSEIGRAFDGSDGLISAAFHRSFDGKRAFNYGQWDSEDAFRAILARPGFNPAKPYWEGLARNEFHLYDVSHIEKRNTD